MNNSLFILLWGLFFILFPFNIFFTSIYDMLYVPQIMQLSKAEQINEHLLYFKLLKAPFTHIYN